jgi:hypothetical protein
MDLTNFFREHAGITKRPMDATGEMTVNMFKSERSSADNPIHSSV